MLEPKVSEGEPEATWYGLSIWQALAMHPIVSQLPILIGVVVGAILSYLGSALAERSRWRRSLKIRWDEKRLDAYASYADAVKQKTQLCVRVAMSLGLGPRRANPLELDDGLPLLADIEDHRAALFEKLLLLGDVETIEAARRWHQSVWDLQLALQPISDGQSWVDCFRRSGLARAHFHEQARKDLGVSTRTPALKKWIRPEEDLF